MAIRKYFAAFIFYLILCFSNLVTIPCTEIRKDKHLSAWDDSDDRWNRWDWRFTLPPSEDHDYLLNKNDDNTGIYFAIFLILFVLLSAFLAYLKYYCEEVNRNSRVSIYNRLTATDSPSSTPTQRSSVSTISRNATPERPHFILEFNNLATDSTNRVYVADPPPRYAEVVIGDLSGEGTFPEVQPTIHETPPPEYTEDNEPRF